MQAHKQVGAQSSCALHTLVERHKKILVAGKRNAIAGFVMQLAFEQLGNDQHDVLFTRSSPPDRAWIFTTMTGIDYHNDRPGGLSIGRN